MSNFRNQSDQGPDLKESRGDSSGPPSSQSPYPAGQQAPFGQGFHPQQMMNEMWMNSMRYQQKPGSMPEGQFGYIPMPAFPYQAVPVQMPQPSQDPSLKKILKVVEELSEWKEKQEKVDVKKAIHEYMHDLTNHLQNREAQEEPESPTSDHKVEKTEPQQESPSSMLRLQSVKKKRGRPRKIQHRMVSLQPADNQALHAKLSELWAYSPQILGEDAPDRFPQLSWERFTNLFEELRDLMSTVQAFENDEPLPKKRQKTDPCLVKQEVVPPTPKPDERLNPEEEASSPSPLSATKKKVQFHEQVEENSGEVETEETFLQRQLESKDDYVPQREEKKQKRMSSIRLAPVKGGADNVTQLTVFRQPFLVINEFEDRTIISGQLLPDEQEKFRNFVSKAHKWRWWFLAVLRSGMMQMNAQKLGISFIRNLRTMLVKGSSQCAGCCIYLTPKNSHSQCDNTKYLFPEVKSGKYSYLFCPIGLDCDFYPFQNKERRSARIALYTHVIQDHRFEDAKIWGYSQEMLGRRLIELKQLQKHVSEDDHGYEEQTRHELKQERIRIFSRQHQNQPSNNLNPSDELDVKLEPAPEEPIDHEHHEPAPEEQTEQEGIPVASQEEPRNEANEANELNEVERHLDDETETDKSDQH